jgi:hypothetical protein
MALRLYLRHPELPTCKNCIEYLYDGDTWELQKDEQGKPQKRWEGCPLPCIKCPKIPEGKDPCPQNAVELSERSKSVYHYELLLREDRTNLLPRDSITVKNAAIIREVERRLDKFDDSAMINQMLRMMLIMGKNR